MALPKLNDKPKYNLTIPSSGKKVKFRPYLVKEEKVLMMAMETQDKSNIINAIVDTIDACVEEDLNRNYLTTFDLEYMFIKIRSKSVGENSKVGIKCNNQECNVSNEVEINLNDIEVEVPEGNREIEITSDITLKMKYPAFNDILEVEELNKTDSEKSFILIGKCIESVVTEDEVISLKDESQKEINEFIESFSTEQFSLIRNFVEGLPRVKKKIEFQCKSCGTENKTYLEGIEDFFT